MDLGKEPVSTNFEDRTGEPWWTKNKIETAIAELIQPWFQPVKAAKQRDYKERMRNERRPTSVERARDLEASVSRKGDEWVIRRPGPESFPETRAIEKKNQQVLDPRVLAELEKSLGVGKRKESSNARRK